MDDAHADDWQKLVELIWGCAIGQAIHVAVELGVPERLATGVMTGQALASETGADPWTLETILRALLAYDILSLDASERYGLTSMGRLLLRDSKPSCAGDAGEFFETIFRPLGGLSAMARTGNVAFAAEFGESFYDYIARDRRRADRFYGAMAENAAYRYGGLADNYDFTPVSRIVDVGGGEASLLVELLRSRDDMTGILLELPEAAGRAAVRLSAAGLDERCDVVAGDFLTTVPGGGDMYLLANVLNNLGNAPALLLLKNVRTAMARHARLLIVEPLYSADTDPRWRALISLGVLAQRGGRTRSEAQHRELLAAAGLRVEQVRRLPSTSSLIEARQA